MSINVCNDRSMASITSLPSGVTGSSLVLLDTVTVTNAGNITFDGSLATGFTSTYKEYIFKLIDIHPVTDNVSYKFGVDTSGNTSYNQTITSSAFEAYHNEADDATGLAYNTGFDVAQGTSGQELFEDQGNDNDQCGCGTLHLFDPSSTTFVKHFIIRSRNTHHGDYTSDAFVSGYINTTTAIDKITFYFASGNQAGTIKMYGVK